MTRHTPDIEWWTTDALAGSGLPDLPTTRRGVDQLAARLGWREHPTLARKRAGRGGGWEYSWKLLPSAAQKALLRDVTTAVVGRGRGETWAFFEALPDAARDKARHRLAVVQQVQVLEPPLGRHGAVQSVAETNSVSVRTIWSWLAMIESVDAADWLAYLAPRHRATAAKEKKTGCSPEFFERLKSVYLQLEGPSFSGAYDVARKLARKNGWDYLTERTARRWFDEPVPRVTQVFAREGVAGLEKCFPPQQRDRTGMVAMEGVVADCHKIDVFVNWPGVDKPMRPQTVVFQDIYSGKVLSWRVDRDPNNRSIDHQDRAFKALRSSLDPLYRAEQQYAAAQAEVNRALATGVVSAEDATNVMRRLEAQYDTARQAALALDGAQEGVSAGFGSMKGQIQNASFQIADVAVQMGAGTSAARALGMQLPQLLGGFWVFGAVAGAAVAIGFPMAESFLGSADAAKELKDQLAELDVVLQSLSDNLKRSKDPDLAATFGNLSGEVRELSRLMLELDRAAELKTLRATLDSLTKSNIDPTFLQRLRYGGGGGGPVMDAAGSMVDMEDLLRRQNFADLGAKISFDEFVDRREMIDAAAKAGDVEKVLREISRLAQDMKGDGAFTDMNTALQELLTSFGQLAVQTAQVEAQWNGTAQSGRDMDDAVKSFAEHQKEVAALTAEIEQSEARKLELAQAEARFGADSAEAQALRVQHAREELDQRMVLAGVAEEDRARILDVYDQTVAVTDQTAAWADTMASVAAEVRGVLGALSSLGGGVVANAAKQAEIDALKAGASVAEAAKARSRHSRNAEFDARAAGAGNIIERAVIKIEQGIAAYGDTLDDQADNLRAAARDRDRKARKSGRAGSGRGSKDSRGTDRQARDEERLIQSIDREMSKLAPSYERDLQAAEKWREEALAGLSKTRAGYEQFAGDVEAIYQERLRKAYEDDLKRRDDWAAGVERAFLRIEDQTTSWADMSEDLVTTWSDGLQQAFIDLNKTGSANVDNLVEHTLEMLQKMIYQMTVQPLLNKVFNWGLNALGGGDAMTMALRDAGAPVTLPTAHTGGHGVMRTYSSANRQRPDERLAMLRDGEQVMTPRMLENAGAVVSALAAAAGNAGGQTVVDARPVINVINNSSAAVTGKVEETTDGRGQRQFRLVMDDAVATAMGVSGGKTQRTMRTQYNINRSGIVR